MHIAYVCNEYPPAPFGGIGAAVATLARGMASAGHRVSVIGVYARASIEERDGVQVFRLAAAKRHRAVNWWLERRLIRQAVEDLRTREGLDVVEWPDFGGLYLRPVAGVADVVKVHGTLMSHRIHGLAKRRPFTERLELHTLRSIRNWVGVSRWFTDEWKRIARVRPDRETIVYNPVDLSLFHPDVAKRSAGLVLYGGGLKERKGVHVLARAARIFLSQCPDARLVLVGFACDFTEEQLRQEAGPVSDRVSFVPLVNQAEFAGYMQAAAVYAMPSLYESCGNTWVEAAACGTPVVGSICSCGPEIVQDGQTGLLADPASPQDVAAKIVRLLRDPSFAGELGRAARQRACELFSLQAAVRTSEQFYAACIAGQR